MRSLTARHAYGMLIAAAVLASTATAQIVFDLQQATARTAPSYSPTYAGHKVIVRGVVSTTALHFPEYTLLPMQDAKGGIVLQSTEADQQLDRYHPGEMLEVQGIVGEHAGMVVIYPSDIRVTGHSAAPKPESSSVADLMGFSKLGRLERMEARVTEIGETTAGPYLLVAGPKEEYKIFLPYGPGRTQSRLPEVEVGDEVRATGVALQYCPSAPYNRWFELVVSDSADIVRTGRSWVIPPIALLTALGAAGVMGFIVWSRERRLRSQRERLRKIYQLGEEILGASSMQTVLSRTTDVLPNILGVTRVHLYVHNRATKTLDTVVPEGEEPLSISLASPPGGTQAGAVACFHYRTLLMIPDIDRSPFPVGRKPADHGPKSVMLVPMLAQNEVIGVLELDQDDRTRDFTADEQALAQHLSNQIAVAVRLLDQRSVQEQLSRTEKMAAVGRLISGVVNELQSPLSSISDLAAKALEKSQASAAEREVAAIAAEAQKASGIVARLVSFAAAEQVEARPVDVNALLHNLIEFRERDWKASGIRVRDLTSRDPLLVLGSEGHLEQVFLNLLVHAEQSLAESSQKVISIRTSVLARRLLVEISFSQPPGSRKAEETAAVLGVTRSVVAGHGGEVRLIDKPNSDPRFEVDLPVASRERSGAVPAPNAPARDASRRMTAMLIEPDEPAQRQLLGLLAARGYRVVPVNNSDTGLELVHRLRFDAAFCSVHAPGLNWVELSERLQSRVGAFILLSDGYDPELSADFEGDGRFVVPKPVQEQELDRVLRSLDSTVAPRSGIA
ncbi:MAG TPA: GAF domain-containing protein [Bryobacteraceae bacterium]|nr:GAF domain-containing protein [Bryobacteraceae bacterium]